MKNGGDTMVEEFVARETAIGEFIVSKWRIYLEYVGVDDPQAVEISGDNFEFCGIKGKDIKNTVKLLQNKYSAYQESFGRVFYSNEQDAKDAIEQFYRPRRIAHLMSGGIDPFLCESFIE